MKPFSVLFSVVLVVCIGLVAGCKPPEQGPAKPRNTAAATAEKQTSQAVPETKQPAPAMQPAEQKMAEYQDIYNVLMDEENGIPMVYRLFIKQTARSRQSDEIILIRIQELENQLAHLKKLNQDKSPDLQGIEQAASELLVSGQTLLDNEKEWLPYFEVKKYQDEDFGKARKVFSALQQDYEKALAALSVFGREIMQYRRTESDRRIDRFRKEGRTIDWHSEEMVALAEELLWLFEDPRVPFNRNEAFSKGNSLIVRIDQSIRAQRKAIDEVRVKNVQVSSHYDVVRNDVSGIINDYREVRDRRSQAAFERMQQKYEKAINELNHAQAEAA